MSTKSYARAVALVMISYALMLYFFIFLKKNSEFELDVYISIIEV